MNDGFYTLLAAAMGCRVYSFEMQRGCVDIAWQGAARNGVRELVTITNSPVSDINGAPMTVSFPADEKVCDGGFAAAGPQRQKRAHAHLTLTRPVTFRVVALDTFVSPSVFIDVLKVDVEGHEPSVLRGAIGLFRQRRVGRAFVEVSARYTHPALGRNATLVDEAIRRVMECGYSARFVNPACGFDVTWRKFSFPAVSRLYGATEFTELRAGALRGRFRHHKCVDLELASLEGPRPGKR